MNPIEKVISFFNTAGDAWDGLSRTGRTIMKIVLYILLFIIFVVLTFIVWFCSHSLEATLATGISTGIIWFAVVLSGSLIGI